ncbi:hypothetical protein [Nostoc sp. FACHB-110]|nr:hypothetical protein [Nostoc sp. FACHB-110]
MKIVAAFLTVAITLATVQSSIACCNYAKTSDTIAVTATAP